MVIGAQQMPFKAHAWVEVDGRVVNDKPYTEGITERGTAAHHAFRCGPHLGRPPGQPCRAHPRVEGYSDHSIYRRLHRCGSLPTVGNCLLCEAPRGLGPFHLESE